MWSSMRGCGLGAVALSFGIGVAAWAAPLEYNVIASESNVDLSVTAQGGIDVNPDFTELLPGGDDFPMFASMAGSSNTQPTTESTVTAEVGLPGAFNNGANGIEFSELSIVLNDLPGPIEGFGVVPIPLDLTGSNNQPIIFFAELSSFRIDLDAPFSSTLTPTGNPNEWLFAGLAMVTLSGVLEPKVTIPTVTEVPLGQFPFSQQVTVPIAGTFSGDQNGTRIALGIEQDALQDQDLNLPPIAEQVVLVPPDLVTLLLNLREFTLADISTAVVYQNATPIPEPNTGLLLALGLAGFAWVRRR